MVVQQWNLPTRHYEDRGEPKTMTGSTYTLLRQKDVIGESQFMMRKHIQRERETEIYRMKSSEIVMPFALLIGMIVLLNI